MAMSKGRRSRQESAFVVTSSLVKSPGHPFYEKLNEMLSGEGFDDFAEAQCAPYYAEKMGRPSIPPGVYFRMLMVGYFEGIDSERGIAWRCADSLALREFLGYRLTETTPDHSSLSVIRNRIDLETHREIFTWVLKLLERKGLLNGKTIGIDATTLEANAALRSIVRRDTGESYDEFLTRLAKASGIDTPTREDMAKIDKVRKNKGSNDDWINPHDPDSKITKMKDGRTHLAHKAEHIVDLQTGAVVAVTLQEANRGDTTTLYETVVETAENLAEVRDDPGSGSCVDGKILREVVADKGYHSNDTMRDLEEMEIRSYVSEPRRKGRRNWKDKDSEREAVYANRRRIRGERGKSLLRKRGELLERPFAHCYETGAMRRTHLRGHRKILKRLLVHVAGCNLSLVMRKMFEIGKPRSLQDLAVGVLAILFRRIRDLRCLCELFGRSPCHSTPPKAFKLRRITAM